MRRVEELNGAAAYVRHVFCEEFYIFAPFHLQLLTSFLLICRFSATLQL